MDADLQDPPEVVLELAERWREGYDVVYAVRAERHGETRFKRATASGFYRVLQQALRGEGARSTSATSGSSTAARSPSSPRCARATVSCAGMFSWIGLSQTGVPYTRGERFAGETKYPLRKMLRFATSGVISFSSAPLRAALNVGFVVSVLAFVLGLWSIVVKIGGFYNVPGWTSTIVVVSFLGGIQLVVLGVIGEYIGSIHDEVKGRPLYVVGELEGFDAVPSLPPRAVVVARSPSRSATTGASSASNPAPNGSG